MGLGFGLCPAQPETLSDVGTSTFSKLGVSNVGKSTELAAAALWDLGLDLLGLYEGLIASVHTLMVLALLVCIFCRLFLLCFLAKHMFLGNLRSTSLRGSYLFDQGFFVPFSGVVVRGGVPRLGHICTKACDPQSSRDQKRKSHGFLTALSLQTRVRQLSVVRLRSFLNNATCI